MERCDDLNDKMNDPKHHTGTPCIEPGCNKPAGTGWGPHWCQACNADRLRRIAESLGRLLLMNILKIG